MRSLAFSKSAPIRDRFDRLTVVEVKVKIMSVTDIFASSKGLDTICMVAIVPKITS